MVDPHSGDHHGHAPSRQADRRYLTLALALIVAFMAVEVVVGLVARSIALISDAGHMLTDAAAIGLALVAMRLAARPASGNYTWGLKRVEILAAQANGLTLWGLAAFFCYEAVSRLVAPPPVHGWYVLVTALVGVAVNLAATGALRRADRRSLNVEGAFRHIVTDLAAFVATAVAGAVILLTGWNRADAVAALLVAVLMGFAGWGLIRESWRVFLEAAPREVDVAAVDAAFHATPGVVEVHDLHVWEVTSGLSALSAHVLVEPGYDCHAVRRSLEHLLATRHGVDHTTLQVEHQGSFVPLADVLRASLTHPGPAHPGHPTGG